MIRRIKVNGQPSNEFKVNEIHIHFHSMLLRIQNRRGNLALHTSINVVISNTDARLAGSRWKNREIPTRSMMTIFNSNYEEMPPWKSKLFLPFVAALVGIQGYILSKQQGWERFLIPV